MSITDYGAVDIREDSTIAGMMAANSERADGNIGDRYSAAGISEANEGEEASRWLKDINLAVGSGRTAGKVYLHLHRTQTNQHEVLGSGLVLSH